MLEDTSPLAGEGMDVRAAQEAAEPPAVADEGQSQSIYERTVEGILHLMQVIYPLYADGSRMAYIKREKGENGEQRHMLYVLLPLKESPEALDAMEAAGVKTESRLAGEAIAQQLFRTIDVEAEGHFSVERGLAAFDANGAVQAFAPTKQISDAENTAAQMVLKLHLDPFTTSTSLAKITERLELVGVMQFIWMQLGANHKMLVTALNRALKAPNLVTYSGHGADGNGEKDFLPKICEIHTETPILPFFVLLPSRKGKVYVCAEAFYPTVGVPSVDQDGYEITRIVSAELGDAIIRLITAAAGIPSSSLTHASIKKGEEGPKRLTVEDTPENRKKLSGLANFLLAQVQKAEQAQGGMER